MTKIPETNFYFWLGRDAELESLMFDEFEERYAEEVAEQEAYLTATPRKDKSD